jgi:hypothetical protein
MADGFANPFAQPQILAAAGITPNTVIRFTGNKTGNVVSASTQEPIGITGEWSEQPPIPLYSTSANIVSTGKPIPFASRGMVGRATVGAGGVTGGSRVMSANGTVIAMVGSAGNWSLGIAMDTAAVGEQVEVWVDPLPF